MDSYVPQSRRRSAQKCKFMFQKRGGRKWSWCVEAHVRVKEHTILDYPDLAFVCTRQHYLPVIVAVTLSLNVIPATHNYTYFRAYGWKKTRSQIDLPVGLIYKITLNTGHWDERCLPSWTGLWWWDLWLGYESDGPNRCNGNDHWRARRVRNQA